ncbi:MAG: transposase, partial [Phycisphaerae bacterium]|nr:transposase [Phycisphaerae bacterium]
FKNWTTTEAADAYMLDTGVQYALNLEPANQSMSERTIQRYERIFVVQDLAASIMEKVTAKLVEVLDLDVSRQRLDSTHVFSDMAIFGRTRMMGVTIKRFLTQLRRHHRRLYEALGDELRCRYAPSQAKLFGDFSGGQRQLRQAVAEDLLFLVNRFSEDQAVANRTSYQAMRRVLEEQCTVSEDNTDVSVKPKTGGKVMQNPSDPDATYDGHKGPGYQVQIAETCSEDNDVQLIAGVEVEPAHQSDQEAVEPMLDQLEQQNRKPEILYADGGYGRDENVVDAKQRGVDLQSPVAGPAPQNEGELTVDDFVIDEGTETVERCPNGCVPKSSTHDAEKGRTRTVMESSDCSACAFYSRCPVKEVRGEFVLWHTPAQRRLAARRVEQRTEAFRKNYRIRAGGESVNSGLKRKTGMGRVRTRGSPRLRLAVLLRCAGWNLFRALAAFKKRGIRDFAASAGAFCRICRILSGLDRRQARARPPDGRLPHFVRRFPPLPILAAA